ncbi:MAG TPA: polysaccharide pyruvyl transferase family protein [Chthonomonadales bacterium]|nr:polysaccharide pyruvyl transferase family protein [Chthonomonadales bacterium]
MVRRFGLRGGPAEPCATQTGRELFGPTTLVIALGGDLFTSDHGIASLRQQAALLQVALDTGSQVCLLGQSIGPFASQAHMEVFRNVATRCRRIVVREERSLTYAVRDVGLPSENVVRGADPSYLLEPQGDAEAMLRYYGIDPDAPIVGVAPSQNLGYWTGLAYEDHLRALVAATEEALVAFGAQVLLVPHVQDVYENTDDREIATNILRSRRYDRRLRCASGDHTAGEYKAMLSRCELVVAERMHAAMAGLSSARPTITVRYSAKGADLPVDLLGREMVAGHDLVVSGEELADARRLTAAMRHAWAHRVAICDGLSSALPQAVLRAERSYDMVVDSLRAVTLRGTT